MDTLLQLSVSGLALGALYALVALGFVIVYRASRVFNFAQGEMVAVGAFAMESLASRELPWPLAAALAMALTGLLAAGIERGVLRRMVGRPVFATIILTIFIGLVLRVAVVVAFGPDERGMPTPWETTGAVAVGGTEILLNAFGSLAAGAVALGAFFLIQKLTRLGVAMRAASSDPEVSLALGIPVGRVLAATWFVAGVMGALAGIFLGMFPRSVDANLGYVALRAFPAAIVGGLDSPGGTVLAALLLGVLEVLCEGYLNPALGDFGRSFHVVAPYLVMIGFLVWRPYGLSGSRDVERV